jgi:hypothetical protein
MQKFELPSGTIQLRENIEMRQQRIAALQSRLETDKNLTPSQTVVIRSNILVYQSAILTDLALISE